MQSHSMAMAYRKILSDGLVLRWELHLIRIGQQESQMMVVIPTVQYSVQLNVIQLFKSVIDGFTYESVDEKR